MLIFIYLSKKPLLIKEKPITINFKPISNYKNYIFHLENLWARISSTRYSHGVPERRIIMRKSRIHIFTIPTPTSSSMGKEP